MVDWIVDFLDLDKICPSNLNLLSAYKETGEGLEFSVLTFSSLEP